MAKLSPELNAAIVRMPVARKDKLLLRLVAKDKLLVGQLIFELLEDKATVDDRVEELKTLIQQEIKTVEAYYFTPGNLLMTMRSLNARITEHVKVTKDKLSEVTLPLYLLAEAFRQYFPKLQKFSAQRALTFSEYVIRRMQFILKKAEKLHEDYHLEFQEELQTVLDFIHRFPSTATLAKEAALPRRWDG
jgi:hypothetical protein